MTLLEQLTDDAMNRGVQAANKAARVLLRNAASTDIPLDEVCAWAAMELIVERNMSMLRKRLGDAIQAGIDSGELPPAPKGMPGSSEIAQAMVHAARKAVQDFNLKTVDKKGLDDGD